MSYTEYLIICMREKIANPELRFGQILFNKLFVIRPELATKIHGSELDPFYVEEKSDRAWVIDGYFIWLEQAWHVR